MRSANASIWHCLPQFEKAGYDDVSYVRGVFVTGDEAREQMINDVVASVQLEPAHAAQLRLRLPSCFA